MIDFLASVMGQVMNGIFKVTIILNTPSIVLSIILFTIAMNLLLTPIVYSQQKFRLAASRMQPILTAIREKYKDRKDQEAAFEMNREIKDVYASYHVKTSMGFLPTMIQIPFIFAIYGVVADIERFVPVLQTGLYNNCYSFIGLPLSESPLTLFEENAILSSVWLKAAVLPGIVFLSQFLPTKSFAKKQSSEKQSMKIVIAKLLVNTLLGGLFSFLCMRLPIGLGVYWVAGSVFYFIRQLFLNKKLEKDAECFDREEAERKLGYELKTET